MYIVKWNQFILAGKMHKNSKIMKNKFKKMKFFLQREIIHGRELTLS